MTSELVVDVQPKEVSIALLEDKSLVELQSEGRNISFSVGNMYLGRIKKLMPGLNACFVDVGYEKDAFLHYLDLGPQFNSLEKFVKQTLSDKKKLNPISKATLLPDLDKDGTVANTLKVGQEVVVQIVKEPISTKGPRLTSEISFAGRYLVVQGVVVAGYLVLREYGYVYLAGSILLLSILYLLFMKRFFHLHQF